MKLKEKIKKIKWLLENQEKLNDLILKMEELSVPKNSDDSFSIEGVPEFQKDYVASIMKGSDNK